MRLITEPDLPITAADATLGINTRIVYDPLGFGAACDFPNSPGDCLFSGA